MVFDFLQPISSELEEFIQSLSNQALGKKVVFHTQTDFPVLENVSLAIITVNEYRGANKTIVNFLLRFSERNSIVCFLEIGILQL